MTRGKLIVIEGTDCSGKQTQTRELVKALKKRGEKVKTISFPRYNTPTGKIVGGPYLGKEHINETWFPEGPAKLDPKISCLYFAADRRAALKEINKTLDSGTNLILDRYTTANLGHQGSKIKDKKERLKMYKWIETLEYGLLELPKPDLVIFLHMPFWASKILKEKRKETATDGHETNEKHLKEAEKTYTEIAKLYNWNTIECTEGKKIKSIKEVQKEILSLFK